MAAIFKWIQGHASAVSGTMGGCIEDEDSGGYIGNEAESSYNLILY